MYFYYNAPLDASSYILLCRFQYTVTNLNGLRTVVARLFGVGSGLPNSLQTFLLRLLFSVA